MFARERDRTDLMNNVAPGFFGMTQQLMIEAIVIRLSRITDNVGSGKKENLTLRRIPDALPDDMGEFTEDLVALIGTAKGQADKVRVWRDKHIAHLDLKHVMSDDSAQFSIGFKEMRESIRAIHAVLNRTSMIAWDTELAPQIAPAAGSAASLITVLKRFRDSE